MNCLVSGGVQRNSGIVDEIPRLPTLYDSNEIASRSGAWNMSTQLTSSRSSSPISPWSLSLNSNAQASIMENYRLELSKDRQSIYAGNEPPPGFGLQSSPVNSIRISRTYASYPEHNELVSDSIHQLNPQVIKLDASASLEQHSSLKRPADYNALEHGNIQPVLKEIVKTDNADPQYHHNRLFYKKAHLDNATQYPQVTAMMEDQPVNYARHGEWKMNNQDYKDGMITREFSMHHRHNVTEFGIPSGQQTIEGIVANYSHRSDPMHNGNIELGDSVPIEKPGHSVVPSSWSTTTPELAAAVVAAVAEASGSSPFYPQNHHQIATESVLPGGMIRESSCSTMQYSSEVSAKRSSPSFPHTCVADVIRSMPHHLPAGLTQPAGTSHPPTQYHFMSAMAAAAANRYPQSHGGYAPLRPPPPPSLLHCRSQLRNLPPPHHHGGFPYSLDGARRKNATRESTTTLKVWLQEHMKNPYPTKGEKIMLAIITKMTLTQVSTWFANARRRLKKENKMCWQSKTSNTTNNSVSNSCLKNENTSPDMSVKQPTVPDENQLPGSRLDDERNPRCEGECLENTLVNEQVPDYKATDENVDDASEMTATDGSISEGYRSPDSNSRLEQKPYDSSHSQLINLFPMNSVLQQDDTTTPCLEAYHQSRLSVSPLNTLDSVFPVHSTASFNTSYVKHTPYTSVSNPIFEHGEHHSHVREAVFHDSNPLMPPFTTAANGTPDDKKTAMQLEPSYPIFPRIENGTDVRPIARPTNNHEPDWLLHQVTHGVLHNLSAITVDRTQLHAAACALWQNGGPDETTPNSQAYHQSGLVVEKFPYGTLTQ